MQKTKTKTVYSFRIKNLLESKGFKPILETNNPRYDGYKCWLFKVTPAFEAAFVEVAGKKGGPING